MGLVKCQVAYRGLETCLKLSQVSSQLSGLGLQVTSSGLDCLPSNHLCLQGCIVTVFLSLLGSQQVIDLLLQLEGCSLLRGLTCTN